jgi:hypothetical protein
MLHMHRKGQIPGTGGWMKPVDVQVITYAPTVFYHCQHCELTFQEMGVGDRIHREQARDALPDDLREEYAAVSDWVHELIERHGKRIKVRVIDAASIEGFWKSIRHGVRKYPTVIVEGKEKRSGADWPSLDPLIDRYLASSDA